MSRILLTCALALAACSTEPSAGIQAETDQDLYEATSQIRVRVTNGTDAAIRYETCPGKWDRKTATGYQRFEVLESCTKNITTVPAGESVDVSYHFPVGQSLGTWRIAVPVGPDELTTEVKTNDFEVVVF